MTDWPRMLYRHEEGGVVLHGVPCETRIVADWQEAEAAHHEGWRRLPADLDERNVTAIPKRRGRPPKVRAEPLASDAGQV